MSARRGGRPYWKGEAVRGGSERARWPRLDRWFEACEARVLPRVKSGLVHDVRASRRRPGLVSSSASNDAPRAAAARAASAAIGGRASGASSWRHPLPLSGAAATDAADKLRPGWEADECGPRTGTRQRAGGRRVRRGDTPGGWAVTRSELADPRAKPAGGGRGRRRRDAAPRARAARAWRCSRRAAATDARSRRRARARPRGAWLWRSAQELVACAALPRPRRRAARHELPRGASARDTQHRIDGLSRELARRGMRTQDGTGTTGCQQGEPRRRPGNRGRSMREWMRAHTARGCLARAPAKGAAESG